MSQAHHAPFRIISGGQAGADRAGLDTAISRGLPHGGWCPQGRRAEDGRIPSCYHLLETPSSDYLDRTARNVSQSDATVIFTAGPLTGGSRRTAEFARQLRKPWLHLQLGQAELPAAAAALARFLRQHPVGVLNVAGSRESKAPGIHGDACEVLALALDLWQPRHQGTVTCTR